MGAGNRVIERLTQRLYGSPLVRNNLRGELVEEIVAMALEPGWQLCSGDWGSCDLIRRADGLRMQVKQSAARQSWHSSTPSRGRPCFSIGYKTGRWEEGDQWIEERSRNADIFVFGWHPVTGSDADHRRPDQWQFFVLPEIELPVQGSVALSVLKRKTRAVPYAALASAVAEAVKRIPGAR